MNPTPETSLIDLFLTLQCKRTTCVENNDKPERMSLLTLDRSIDWLAGHAGQNVHILFRGCENLSSMLDLIERAVSRCRKWEVCHPVQFTLTLVIDSLDIEEESITKLEDWNVNYFLSSDKHGAIHHGSQPAKYPGRSFNLTHTQLSINPEGKIFACLPMTSPPEQDELSLGDVFNWFDVKEDVTAPQREQKEKKHSEKKTSRMHLEKKYSLALEAIGALCILFSLTISTTSAEVHPNGVTPTAITAAHNQWRAQVNVPDLTWSDDLAASARSWSEHLAADSCLMKHSTTSNGENIYWASPLSFSDGTKAVQGITDQDVVDAWGNEISSYDYASNSCHGVCGHYTQVVWKSTREVGCGMTVCGDQGQIWVCQYSPAGNMIGQRPY